MKQKIFDFGNFFPSRPLFAWNTQDEKDRTYTLSRFSGQVKVLEKRGKSKADSVLTYKKRSGSDKIEIDVEGKEYVDKFIKQFAPEIEDSSEAICEAVKRMVFQEKLRRQAVIFRSKGVTVAFPDNDSVYRIELVPMENYGTKDFDEIRNNEQYKDGIIVNEKLLIFPADIVPFMPSIRQAMNDKNCLEEIRDKVIYADGGNYARTLYEASVFYTVEFIEDVFGEGAATLTYLSKSECSFSKVNLIDREQLADDFEEQAFIEHSIEGEDEEEDAVLEQPKLVRNGIVPEDKRNGCTVYTLIDNHPVKAMVVIYGYTGKPSQDVVSVRYKDNDYKKRATEVFSDKNELTKSIYEELKELN